MFMIGPCRQQPPHLAWEHVLEAALQRNKQLCWAGEQMSRKLLGSQ